MKKLYLPFLLILLIVILVVAGYSGSNTVTETPLLSITPTLRITLVPIPTLSPTTTPIPLATPTPPPMLTLTPREKVDIKPFYPPLDAIFSERKMPSIVICRGDTSKTEIAFTFDDSGANFDKILATLKEKGINGTFFILTAELRNNPERWQQAVKDGNLVCSHGTSHDFSLCRKSDETIRKDLLNWEEAAIEVLGEEYVEKMKEDFPYFRSPGGNTSKRELEIIGELGYKFTIYWTCEDCWSMLPENNPLNLTMNQIFIKGAMNGAVFLLHPPYQSHLSKIIDGVEEKGYVFVTLPEILD